MTIEIPEATDDDTLVFRNREDRSVWIDSAEGDHPQNVVPKTVLAHNGHFNGIERQHDPIAVDWSGTELQFAEVRMPARPRDTRHYDGEGEGRDTSTPEQ